MRKVLNTIVCVLVYTIFAVIFLFAAVNEAIVLVEHYKDYEKFVPVTAEACDVRSQKLTPDDYLVYRYYVDDKEYTFEEKTNLILIVPKLGKKLEGRYDPNNPKTFYKSKIDFEALIFFIGSTCLFLTMVGAIIEPTISWFAIGTLLLMICFLCVINFAIIPAVIVLGLSFMFFWAFVLSFKSKIKQKNPPPDIPEGYDPEGSEDPYQIDQ